MDINKFIEEVKIGHVQDFYENTHKYLNHLQEIYDQLKQNDDNCHCSCMSAYMEVDKYLQTKIEGNTNIQLSIAALKSAKFYGSKEAEYCLAYTKTLAYPAYYDGKKANYDRAAKLNNLYRTIDYIAEATSSNEINAKVKHFFQNIITQENHYDNRYDDLIFRLAYCYLDKDQVIPTLVKLELMSKTVLDFLLAHFTVHQNYDSIIKLCKMMVRKENYSTALILSLLYVKRIGNGQNDEEKLNCVKKALHYYNLSKDIHQHEHTKLFLSDNFDIVSYLYQHIVSLNEYIVHLKYKPGGTKYAKTQEHFENMLTATTNN